MGSRTILFVAIGGMLGSVCRYLMVTAVVSLLPFAFPFGTLVVNILGSFVMGAAVGLAEHYLWMQHDWRIFLTAGFCGGFTTFSAFAFENVELLIDKNYLTFGVYSFSSFVLCLGAAFLGLVVTRGS